MQKNHGISLLEMLVVVALLAIVLKLAAPSFFTLQQKLQAKRDIIELQRMLHFSREQAIGLSTRVALCPLNSSNQCSSHWNQGITLFTDPNNNKKLDSNEQTLYQFQAVDNSNTLRSFNNQAIGFNRLGYAEFSNGRLTYCLQNTRPIQTAFVIARTGRIKTNTTTAFDSTIPCIGG